MIASDPPANLAPPAAAHGKDAGRLDDQGNRYWEVEVWRMPPLYQELYERIFAERLTLWGAGAACTVRRTGRSIVYGGPEALMRDLDPSAAVRRHIRAGDEDWIAALERRWRAAGTALEAEADRLWSALLAGEAAPEHLRSLLDRKVAFNAIGVDSVMPPVGEGERWLRPHVDEDVLADVLDACYLPASGRVAYDELELECRLLARACPPGEPMPEAARARFVGRGLFYLFDALDTDRRTHFLEEVPRQVAARYRRAALGRAALDAGIAEIDDRAWRRRYHRQWGRRQIEQVPAAAAREPLLMLHGFAGGARDYDEEKRRINMKLWRALFALADGLRVSLMGPGATAEGLCAALARHDGAVAVDRVFLTDR